MGEQVNKHVARGEAQGLRPQRSFTSPWSPRPGAHHLSSSSGRGPEPHSQPIGGAGRGSSR